MRAAVALGSNLGDRAGMIRAAVEAISQVGGVTVLAVSRLHETDPVGGPEGQGRFLNAALLMETTLTPDALLAECLGIEAKLGRIRTGLHWGPRCIDLDVLFYGDVCRDTPQLTLPHPRMAERAFVLEPLFEICPDWVHPRSGMSVREMYAALPDLPGAGDED